MNSFGFVKELLLHSRRCAQADLRHEDGSGEGSTKLGTGECDEEDDESGDWIDWEQIGEHGPRTIGMAGSAMFLQIRDRKSVV